MLRRIIEINPDLCNGCGICVDACHEGAIALQNNKAVLTRDDYCDGLGDCLPNCPTGAISFLEKDTLAYDDIAVKANIAKKKLEREQQVFTAMASKEESDCGCPGSHSKSIHKQPSILSACQTSDSQLATWPLQLQLVSTRAPFFQGADVLLAADCTAFAYANFHQEFMKGKVTLIACPKLDSAAYVEKIAELLKNNDIKSISIARMQVPCCGGLVSIVKQAILLAKSQLPLLVTTITTDGQILSDIMH